MALYLGIEVTAGQVKGVLLKTAYRKLLVESVVRVQRLPGSEGLTTSVREIVSQLPAAVDATYASFPGTDVSLRIVTLPRAVARRGGKVLATELEGSLPFDIEDALIDAQTISSGENVELFAAAARQDRVREFVECLKAAGADPREVGVGPVALGELAEVVPELADAGPVLVLYTYESFADLAVLVGGVVHMARTLGSQISPDARARALRQTLGAYQAGGGVRPIRAFVCGEWALQNMDVVADALSLPADAVSAMLPLGSIDVSPLVSRQELQLAPAALAVALRGLRNAPRLNLRRGALAVSNQLQILRDRAPLLAACLGALVVGWGFAAYARYASIADERTRLVQVLGRITQETFGERITNPRRAREVALGGGGEAEQDPQPGADSIDVIGVLSTRIPEAVRHDLTQLDVQEEHVQVQGVVGSLQDRDQIVEALGHYECFQNVRPGRAQRNPGDSRQQYALDLDLRCPERQQAGARRGSSTAGNRTTSSSSTTGGTSGNRN